VKWKGVLRRIIAEEFTTAFLQWYKRCSVTVTTKSKLSNVINTNRVSQIGTSKN
jgi:hypothetical protein